MGLWSGRDKATCRPSIAKREYESTPVEFAKWLVELAKSCQPKQRGYMTTVLFAALAFAAGVIVGPVLVAKIGESFDTFLDERSE